VLAACLFVAGVFVALSLFAFLCFAGAVLFFTLIAIASLSLYFSLLTVTGYLSWRLYKQVRQNSTYRDGFDAWFVESKSLISASSSHDSSLVSAPNAGVKVKPENEYVEPHAPPL